MRFDRAYVQYPVCNPSRVSMLTGTRPEHNGITGNAKFFREKMPEIVTLPELFRQHGATALSFGKIYHAGLVGGTDTKNRFSNSRCRRWVGLELSHSLATVTSEAEDKSVNELLANTMRVEIGSSVTPIKVRTPAPDERKFPALLAAAMIGFKIVSRDG